MNKSKKEGENAFLLSYMLRLSAHVIIAVVNRFANIAEHAASSGKDVNGKVLILVHRKPLFVLNGKMLRRRIRAGRQ